MYTYTAPEKLVCSYGGLCYFHRVDQKKDLINQVQQSKESNRLDVTMQEADRVDALYGFQDLATETQGGADAECPPGHTPP